MPRITATLSISVPPEMAKQLDKVRKNEHRTRSELVREALRRYIRDSGLRELRERIAGLPEEEPTADELEAIAQAGKPARDKNPRSSVRLRHGSHAARQRTRRKKP